MSELKITTYRGSFEVEFSNGNKERFSPRGVALFTRRAILRVGMLLRDSEIAKEVRTQLLNIEEKTTQEQKDEEINEETRIQMEIGQAIMTGKLEDILVAFGNGMAYKNRYILDIEKRKKELEKENENLNNVNIALTHGTRSWKDRNITNALMRVYALKCHNHLFGKAWNVLYKELKYKKSIDVHARKSKGNLIDQIKPEEWTEVLEIATALCKSNGIDVGKIINEVNELNILEELNMKV
jgi:hypothetical protein